MTDMIERLLALAGNINLRPEESELCADAAEEIKSLCSRVAELEQMLCAAQQVIAGTATITKHFPDSGTPRVDVREVVVKLGRRDERRIFGKED